MISLMKYTYMMSPKGVESELNKMWGRYEGIINSENPSWSEVNEARSLLYLTGQIFCEQIAVEAIKRRLHLLKVKLSLIEFLDLIDKKDNGLVEMRKDELFAVLEKFYIVIKNYKNKYIEGEYYLEEERFLKVYERVNPDKSLKIGYRGKF